MFRCKDCGAGFSEPLVKGTEIGWNTENGFRSCYEMCDYCPECGSDDIEEVSLSEEQEDEE